MSQCAVHPESAATFVCERCGAFGCVSCRAPGPVERCVACESRLAAEAERVPVGEALSAGFGLPVQHARATAVYLALSSLPRVVSSILSEVLGPSAELQDRVQKLQASGKPEETLAELMRLLPDLVPWLVVGAVTGLVAWATWLLATGALTLTVTAAIGGQRISIAESYRGALRRWAPMLLCNAWVTVVGYLGLACCVVPGLVLLVAGAYIGPAVVVGGLGPLDGFGASWRLIKRTVGPVVLLFLLSEIAQTVVNEVAKDLGPAFSHIPLGTTGIALLGAVVGRAAELPLICGVAYLYARLERPTRSGIAALSTRG